MCGFENGREELRSAEVFDKQRQDQCFGPDGDSRALTPEDFTEPLVSPRDPFVIVSGDAE